jgi:hypothetical protein
MGPKPYGTHGGHALVTVGFRIVLSLTRFAAPWVDDDDAPSLFSLSARPRLAYPSAPVTPLDDLIPDARTERRDHAL